MTIATDFFQEANTLQSTNPEKAIELYKQSIEADPTFLDAYNGLGNILLNAGKREEAIKQYEKCIELNPEYKWAYFNLGLSYSIIDIDKSVEYYNKAIEIDPVYVDAYLALGNIYLGKGLIEEAKANYEKCLEIDPNLSIAYFNLGLLLNKAEPENAKTNYEKAIALDPNRVDSYLGLGNIYFDKNDFSKAREQYLKCIELDANYDLAYFNVGLTYENRDNSKAKYYYEKTISINSSFTYALNGLGNIYLEEGNLEEAIVKYEKCIEIDPNFIYAYHNLGLSFEKKDTDKAIAYYEKALLIDPSYPHSYFGLGKIFQEDYKFEEARLKYEKCIEYSPDSYLAYYNIYVIISQTNNEELVTDFVKLVEEKKSAYGYWALGNLYNYFIKDFDKSLHYYNKSRELKEMKEILLDISNHYDATSNLEKAIEILDEAISQDKENVYTLHNKANYLFKKGEYDKARKLCDDALQKYEDKLESDKTFSKDPSNYLYVGGIYFEVLGEYEKAIKLFTKGLKQDETHLGLLLALNKVYAVQSGIMINPDVSLYWKRNANLKTAEKVLKKPFVTAQDQLTMTELYFTEEKYEKAKELINNFLKTGKESAPWYNLKGQLHLIKDEFKEAVWAFKTAIKLEPHNLSLTLNLGNAYLRNKDYFDADNIFKKILKRDPNNVDALIGLGESIMQRSSDEPDEAMLESAENYFKDAVRLGKSGAGSKRLDLHAPKSANKERVYKDIKLSDIYYALGYIKTKQYEDFKVGIKSAYLNDSLNYFIKACECDPENHKALAAKSKVEKYVNTNKETNRLESFGAVLVIAMAFILFVGSQYFFYFGTKSNDQYILNDNAVDYLESILSDVENEIKDIDKLKGIKFEDKNTLVEALKSMAGTDFIQNNSGLIDSIDLKVSTDEKVDLLPAGYYVLISFGSIVFMIAGLYLPKILKLKVGVIELEKNQPTEMNSISLIGILSPEKSTSTEVMSISSIGIQKIQSGQLASVNIP
ncbi:tetratricopeptide repeat protein [Chondrinema litorale]|uniref:tetratricopeptide repeat protein n=1 Tax=Chondrinema litorale TaxID=2994555 RepID=UPI002543DCA5|nr:tetratricopeptide repeat protein [Chondrinema litorale]UZR98759.1 tetratricopeptide repeat protein [Chondrinema litorale]